MPKIVEVRKEAKMKGGVEVVPLYVKNLSKSHWDLINELKTQLQTHSTAHVIRWALEKASGKF